MQKDRTPYGLLLGKVNFYLSLEQVLKLCLAHILKPNPLYENG